MHFRFAQPIATTTRSRLILLVAAILVPLALFATALSWQFAAAERARYRNHAQDLSLQISTAVDRELVALTAALEGLATSPALGPQPDLQAFYRQAQALLRTRGAFIALRDTNGQQLINTSQPFGAKLPAPKDPRLLATDRTVLVTGKPAVSDLYVSAATGRQLVLIDTPVFQESTVAYLLSIALQPERLSELLATYVPPGWTASLIDREGRVLARSRQQERFVGKAATPDLVREATGASGSWEGLTLEGTEVLSAYSRSVLSGWRAVVGVPLTLIEAPVQRLIAILAGSAAVVVLLAVTLARRVARTISTPMAELTIAAARLGRGEPITPIRTDLAEVDAVSSALIAAHAAVTERETALQASEERFRAAVHAVEGVLWTNDASGRMAGEQPGWAALTGQTRAEYEGYGWAKGVHPDDAQPTVDAWEQAVQARKTFVFQHRVRRHDGVYRRFSVRAIPIVGADGSVREWVGVHADITDEHEALRSLAESQARLRAVFEAAPVGIVIAEAPSGRIIDGNAQAERILGHPILHSESVESYREWPCFHADGSPVEPHEYPLARVIRGDEERPVLEAQYKRGGDGRMVWVRLAGSVIRDASGRLIGGVVAVLDLDREKRAEAGLRELNATLERRVEETIAERDRIWRISTELMLVARFGGKIVATNPAWRATLGWSASELFGTSFMDLVHPDDAGQTQAEMRRLAEGAATPRFENRYRHKDGSYRWLSWTAVPEAGLIHAIGRDMTAEKAAAEALRQTEDKLRQSQKMEAVGQLTGGVAHDFNNLLTVVSGNLEMALRRVDGQDGSRIARNLETALEGARRAATLTSRLLAFSRQSPLQPEPVALNVIIAGMAELIRRTLGETIRIETRLAEGLWMAEADPNQLESAILNLCINARDAMPDGGTLSIETENVDLNDSFLGVARGEIKPGPYAVITVTDTGMGMTPEIQERVFEPFFTTKPVGKGTGLGLSQVFGFLRQSGGHAVIESEPGQGTTVRLFFPRLVAAAQAPGHARDQLVAPGDGSGATILVVEDEDMVREFTTAALEEGGYRVLAAPDGPSGLHLLDRHPEVRLLFSDMVLAGPMNGREVAEAAMARRPELPVLLTTGYTRDALVQEGRLGNGLEVIAKPFTPAALLRKVQGILGRVANDA